MSTLVWVVAVGVALMLVGVAGMVWGSQGWGASALMLGAAVVVAAVGAWSWLWWADV